MIVNPPTAAADLERAGLRPSAALADTVPREFVSGNTLAASASGTLRFVPIYLGSALTITSITFFSGNVAAGTPSNQWFCLYTSGLSKLGVTTDDTTTAWAAGSAKTLSLSPGPIAVSAPGVYLLGVLVVAASGPNFQGIAANQSPQALASVLNGTSNGGLTNPASAPSTANAINSSASGGVPYAYVS